jgi:hypothetical protein
MTFSQAWDAGFRSVLIFIGVVFVWLGVVEARIDDRALSETLMIAVAVATSSGFFLRTRNRCRREKANSEEELRAAGEGNGE